MGLGFVFYSVSVGLKRNLQKIRVSLSGNSKYTMDQGQSCVTASFLFGWEWRSNGSILNWCFLKLNAKKVGPDEWGVY